MQRALKDLIDACGGGCQTTRANNAEFEMVCSKVNGPLFALLLEGNDVSETSLVMAGPMAGAIGQPKQEAGTAANVRPVRPHEGYWFDPTDSTRDAADPMIYVRYLGVARRVPLSKAKAEHGVPSTATPATMTHYSEREGRVKIDRGTHRTGAP